MVAQRAAFIFGWRRPDDVSHGTDEEIGTSRLYTTAVGIKVHVTHRLPTAQATQYEILAIRMYHI